MPRRRRHCWCSASCKGLGTLHYTNGYVYHGEFVNNVEHGSCELLCPNGDMFRGQTNQNTITTGELVMAQGTMRYQGSFNKQGELHGKGRLSVRSGITYTGVFDRGNVQDLPTRLRLQPERYVTIRQGEPLQLRVECVNDAGKIIKGESRRRIMITVLKRLPVGLQNLAVSSASSHQPASITNRAIVSVNNKNRHDDQVNRSLEKGIALERQALHLMEQSASKPWTVHYDHELYQEDHGLYGSDRSWDRQQGACLYTPFGFWAVPYPVIKYRPLPIKTKSFTDDQLHGVMRNRLQESKYLMRVAYPGAMVSFERGSITNQEAWHSKFFNSSKWQAHDPHRMGLDKTSHLNVGIKPADVPTAAAWLKNVLNASDGQVDSEPDSLDFLQEPCHVRRKQDSQSSPPPAAADAVGTERMRKRRIGAMGLLLAASDCSTKEDESTCKSFPLQQEHNKYFLKELKQHQREVRSGEIPGEESPISQMQLIALLLAEADCVSQTPIYPAKTTVNGVCTFDNIFLPSPHRGQFKVAACSGPSHVSSSVPSRQRGSNFNHGKSGPEQQRVSEPRIGLLSHEADILVDCAVSVPHRMAGFTKRHCAETGKTSRQGASGTGSGVTDDNGVFERTYCTQQLRDNPASRNIADGTGKAPGDDSRRSEFRSLSCQPASVSSNANPKRGTSLCVSLASPSSAAASAVPLLTRSDYAVSFFPPLRERDLAGTRHMPVPGTVHHARKIPLLPGETSDMRSVTAMMRRILVDVGGGDLPVLNAPEYLSPEQVDEKLRNLRMTHAIFDQRSDDFGMYASMVKGVIDNASKLVSAAQPTKVQQHQSLPGAFDPGPAYLPGNFANGLVNASDGLNNPRPHLAVDTAALPTKQGNVQLRHLPAMSNNSAGIGQATAANSDLTLQSRIATVDSRTARGATTRTNIPAENASRTKSGKAKKTVKFTNNPVSTIHGSVASKAPQGSLDDRNKGASSQETAAKDQAKLQKKGLKEKSSHDGMHLADSRRRSSGKRGDANPVPLTSDTVSTASHTYSHMSSVQAKLEEKWDMEEQYRVEYPAFYTGPRLLQSEKALPAKIRSDIKDQEHRMKEQVATIAEHMQNAQAAIDHQRNAFHRSAIVMRYTHFNSGEPPSATLVEKAMDRISKVSSQKRISGRNLVNKASSVNPEPLPTSNGPPGVAPLRPSLKPEQKRRSEKPGTKRLNVEAACMVQKMKASSGTVLEEPRFTGETAHIPLNAEPKMWDWSLQLRGNFGGKKPGHVSTTDGGEVGSSSELPMPRSNTHGIKEANSSEDLTLNPDSTGSVTSQQISPGNLKQCTGLRGLRKASAQSDKDIRQSTAEEAAAVKPGSKLCYPCPPPPRPVRHDEHSAKNTESQSGLNDATHDAEHDGAPLAGAGGAEREVGAASHAGCIEQAELLGCEPGQYVIFVHDITPEDLLAFSSRLAPECLLVTVTGNN
eukprot:scpid3387/ scgid4550/ MORN repeat-containing protein 1